MRTKQILTAMVLPALLAACTADDFVDNNSANIEGRALLNPITFHVGNAADTRFAWNEEGFGNWTYEDTDAFSAFLVDGTKNSVSNNLLTNYIYKSKDGNAFTTTSQMVEGIYWFYAPAQEDKNTRDLISFKLKTAQDADYYKSEDAQVFFTALYQLSKDDDPQNIDLALTNYYSRAVFPLTNNLDKNVKINQIILESNKDLAVEGKIAVDKLTDYMYGFTEDGEMVSAKNLDDKKDNDETVKELQARLRKADIASDTKTTKTLVLNLGDGAAIAKGETKEFTMLVPRTDEGVSCNIKIITDQGVATISSTDASNYAKNVQFKHNGIMPIFGQKNDGSFKSYSIEKDKLDDLGGARYVTSYDDMITLINTINGDFEVYNLGDWAVDAAMAKAITNSDSYVTFNQPITIEDAKNKVSLTKVNFKDVVVAKGTTASFAKGEVAEKKNKVEKLTVEAGATVDLVEGDFANVVNAGTLKVTKNAEKVNVASTGALTLEDNASAKITLNAGSLKYTTASATGATYNMTNLTLVAAGTMTANLDITIEKGVVLQQNKGWLDTPTNKVGNVTYVTNLVNNGVLRCTGAGLSISGNMENNGLVDETGGPKTLTIKKVAKNAANGVIKTKLSVEEDAVVTNEGKIEAATNNGTIVAAAGSKTVVAGGDGTIDNTALANVSGTLDNQNVFYKYTEDVTAEELGELDVKFYNISRVVFGGKLTLNEILKMPIDEFEFVGGSSLYVDAKVQQGLKQVDVYVSGAVTFSGFKSDGDNASAINWETSNSILVKKNSTLTIEDLKIDVTSGNTLTFKTEELGDKDKAGIVTIVDAVVKGTNDTTNPVTLNGSDFVPATTGN